MIILLLKLMIILGAYTVFAYGPRIINSIVHGVECPAIQVKIVAIGFAMITGGFIFLS